MFCHTCGAQLPEGTKFCLKCGANQEVTNVQTVDPVQRKKRRRRALWFIFGPIVAFIVILMLWGLLTVIATASGFENSPVMMVMKILMPILILACVACFIIGLIVGIVLLVQR